MVTIFLPSAYATTKTVCESGCDHTTIQAAITAATAGDTILVSAKAGNAAYDEVLNFGGKNLILDGSGAGTGTQAKLTNTITPNDQGGSAVLQMESFPGSSMTSATVVKNFHIIANDSTPRNAVNIFGGAYPVFMNNTLENSSSSTPGSVFYIYGNAGDTTPATTLSGNTITASGGTSAFYVVNRSVVIKNNVMRTTGTGKTNQLSGQSVQFTNNLLSGSDLYVSAGNNTPSVATTAVIANNTFDGTNENLRLQDTSLNDGYTLTAYVKNNIFRGANIGITINETDATSTAQTPVRADPVTLYSDYNLFYPDPTQNPNFKNLVVVTIQTYTYYTTLASWQAARGQDANSYYGDPYFTTWTSTRAGGESPYFASTPNNDYTLRNYSPAIGHGTNKIVSATTNDLGTYGLTTDLAGSARPKTGTTVDIGAYENQTMGDWGSISVASMGLNATTSRSQATATAYFTAGPSQDVTSLATWASTDTSKASVNASGMVFGFGTGTAGITATFASLTSNTASVTTVGLPDYVSLYVDANNGNDSTGDGTSGAPYKTLATAMNNFVAGGRMFLKGTFAQSITITSSLSGTADQNTWITNWPGTTATINNPGSTAEITINGASYITIQGLNVTGATSEGDGLIGGIVVQGGSSYITLNANTVYGNQFGIADSGASGANSNITLSSNTLHDNTSTNILLLSSNATTLYNNVLFNAGLGVGFLGASNNVNIWNNTLMAHGVGIGAYDINGDGDPTVTNTTVKNNLIYQPAGQGVGAAVKMVGAVNTGTGNSFDYNLYYAGNGIPLVTVDSTDYLTLAAWRAASAHDDNSVGGDPLFVAEDNYAITEASPAYNVGTSTGAPSGVATDITGNVTRIGGYDIGAYEADLRPTAASELEATAVDTNALTLDWTDNASGIRQETGFTVKYSITSATAGFDTTAATVAADAVTASITNLLPSTTYWFVVRGTNAAGSIDSAALQVATLDPGSTQHSSGETTPTVPVVPTPPVVTDPIVITPPPVSLRREMSSFSSVLGLVHFIVTLPASDRVSDYVDFNNDTVFNILDLRVFLDYLRGR